MLKLVRSINYKGTDADSPTSKSGDQTSLDVRSEIKIAAFFTLEVISWFSSAYRALLVNDGFRQGAINT